MPFRHNRPARLSRSRTNDNSPPTTTLTSNDNEDIVTKRPTRGRDSIQALTYQQLVTQRLLQREASDSSTDSAQSDDMKIRSRISRTASSLGLKSSDPKSSSSTVNTIVSTIESRIDVEQAIGLLQELKKNASPKELVALHRALLPTKDESQATSPQLPSIEEHAYTSAPPARKSSRSVMPPGLATRSGLSEDVLRKPQAAPSSHTPTRVKTETRIEPPSIFDSPNGSPTRLGTPNSQSYFHAGAFQSGTLRITNGRASPDPSIISKLALDVVGKGEDAQGTDSEGQSGKCEPSGTPVITQPFSSAQTQDLELYRPTVMRPGSLDAHPRARPLLAPLSLDKHVQQRHSFDQMPMPRSSDDVPRFQQRINHRATQLSQEYTLDCGMTASPYEEKDGLFDFASRLSTVCDNEDDADDENTFSANAHASTLSILEGTVDRPENGVAGSSAARDSQDTIIPSTSSTQKPPKVVRKQDSGYCSDVPSTPIHKLMADAPEAARVFQNQSPANDINEAQTQTTEDPSQQDTADSSNSPQQHAAPSPRPSLRRSPLSLFKSKSRGAKRSKSSFSVLSVEQGSSRISDDGEKSSRVQTCPSEVLIASTEKQPKKLQKPMPESIRRQRKKTIESLRESHESSLQVHQPSERCASSPAPSRPATSRAGTEIHLVPQQDNNTKPGTDGSPKSEGSKSRSRALSFGRKRSKTLSESKADSQSCTSSPSRHRSKSNASVSAPIPVSRSQDESAEQETSGSKPSATGSSSSHTSFASVARALNSNPPDDLAHSEKRPTRPVGMHKRYYSNPDVVKSSDASDAKEDTGLQQNVSDVDGKSSDVPPPSSPSRSDDTLTPVAVGSQFSVEDRFPGWQGKPASRDSSPSRVPPPPVRHFRSHSKFFKDAVPPMPAELPADIDLKVSKADKMIAKKLKNSPRSSPIASARSSFDTPDLRKQSLVNTANSRREQAAKQEQEASPVTAIEPAASEKKKSENGGDNAPEMRWSLDGSIQLPRADQHVQPSSPSHDSQHPGWPGWEQQASLWKKRREAMALAVEEPDVTEASPEHASTSANAPEIVFSRYITPLGAETAHNARRNTSESWDDRASQLAQSYADLISDNKENRPARSETIERPDSIVSTATFVTMQSYDDRPAKVDVSRTGSAISTTSTMSTTTSVSRYSWNGSRGSHNSSHSSTSSGHHHIRTQSNKFIPYRAADAAQAERSRALSLARRSCQIAERSNESLALPASPPALKKRSSESLFDRYGGGLKYGWDREKGFRGSAGTRAMNTFDPKNRKSVKMSEEFGLDLSDVPVFLRKEPSFGVVR